MPRRSPVLDQLEKIIAQGNSEVIEAHNNMFMARNAEMDSAQQRLVEALKRANVAPQAANVIAKVAASDIKAKRGPGHGF